MIAMNLLIRRIFLRTLGPRSDSRTSK